MKQNATDLSPSNRRPWLRRCLFGAVSIVTLYALFVSVEDWRAARAMEAFRKDCASKNASLDLAAYEPPKVPDAANVAKSPVIESYLAFNRAKADPTRTPGPRDAEWRALEAQVEAMATRDDLFESADDGAIRLQRGLVAGTEQAEVELSPSEAAEAGLAALESSTLIADLVQACEERPEWRWEANWRIDPNSASGLLRQWREILENMTLSKALRFHAVLCLAARRPSDAERSTLALVGLAKSFTSVPLLFGYVMTQNVHWQLREVIVLGLPNRNWSDGFLSKIEVFLASQSASHVFRQCAYHLKSERALSASLVVENWAIDRRSILIRFGIPTGFLPLCRLIPDGWVQQAVISYGSALGAQIECYEQLPSSALTKEWLNSVFDKGVRAADSAGSPMSWAASPMLKMLHGIPRSVLQMTSETALLRTAMAAERHRIATGKLPAEAQALVPHFLPEVPIDPTTLAPCPWEAEADGNLKLGGDAERAIVLSPAPTLNS